MFSATARRQLGDGSFQVTLVFERRFTLHVVERRALAFDSRFVPAPTARSENSLLYLVLEGELELCSSPPRELRGPVAVRMEEATFEGAPAGASGGLRTRGAVFRALELRAHRSDLAAPSAGEIEVIELGPDIWASAQALHASARAGDPSLQARVSGWLDALAAGGWASRELSTSVTAEDPRFARVWAGVRPLAERFSLLPSLDELAGVSGLSLRQLARDIEGFVRTFRLPDRSWRETTRRLRLKTALLGLSASGLSISEVARAAGFGSVEAMARAFRDNGLPPPSAVRESLRA